jgi:hypothetical protein
VITAPERFSLAGATATVTLSENADIEPNPASITDWDVAQTFTVTSYNGIVNKYDYSVERRLVSRDGDVVLLTQADVEAFAAELDADQINGTLTVGAASGQDTVYSLASLAGRLKIITGGVIVNATYAGEDLAGLSENLEKTGDLKITSKTVEIVSFPKLVALRADLSFDQAVAIKTIDFPELTTVDKGLQINYTDSLETINFPKLRQVIEVMSIQSRYNGSNLKLESIDLPELQSVGSNFTIAYWQGLTAIHIPQLKTVGTFSFSNLTALTAINSPALKATSSFSLSSLTALPTIDFPALETVNGAFTVNNCQEITELTFSALKSVSNTLSVSANKLELLSLPSLESVGSISKSVPLDTEIQLQSLKTITGTLSLDDSSNPLAMFPALDSVGIMNIIYGDYEATLDLRGIKVGTITSYAMGKIILFGDDIYSTRFIINNAFPFIVREGFKTIGSITLSNIYDAVVDFSWMENVRGGLSFFSVYSSTFDFSNLRSAGGIGFNYSSITSLNMPSLETITGYINVNGVEDGGFTYPESSDITSLTFPKLKSVVGNISITGAISVSPLETIGFPALQSITGTLTISGTNNATFKDLSGFSALTSADGITVNGFTQLTDFEPLKNVIPSLNSWAIAGCGYNPTYQDMLDGRTKN